jgi:hypothetical protein
MRKMPRYIFSVNARCCRTTYGISRTADLGHVVFVPGLGQRLEEAAVGHASLNLLNQI